MKNEELRQKYRFLKVVAEQDVRTYHALDAGGRLVMVHYLPAGTPETERLLGLLDELTPVDKMRIVERVQVDGAPVLVTDFIQNLKTLPDWVRVSTERPRGTPTPPAVLRRGAGDMTQLFGPSGGDRPPAPEPPRAAEAAPRPAPPPSPPPPSLERAGEFTGLFGAAADSRPAPLPSPVERLPEPPPPPLPPSPQGDKPPNIRWRERSSEEPAKRNPDRPVVRWKKDSTPAPDRPPAMSPPPPPPSPRPKPAGDLTGLFGPSGSGTTEGTVPPAPSPSSSPPMPPAPSGASPGEFTRLFQTAKPEPHPSPRARDYLEALNTQPGPPDMPPAFGPPAPPTQPAASGPVKEPGEFTRIMSGIPTTPNPTRADSRGPTGAPPPPSAPSNPGGPSDFTRIIAGAQPSPPAGQRQSPLPAEEPADDVAPRRSSRLLVLIVALSLVCVIAIAVVLYVALKGR